jgi:predicted nucleotidyltransferase
MASLERFSASLARERARRAARFLSRDRRIRLVFLFGSAADERCVEVGDVDVAFLARPALSFEERLRLQADVSAAAGGPVDLVPINAAPVALSYEIADGGQCLFTRDPDEEVEFVTRARARYWDFRPYLEEQSRLAAERQKERLRGSPS